MRVPPSLAAVAVALLAGFLQLCAATTLTYVMPPGERACFYAMAAKADEKMSFYFAVQDGGSFDVDFEVTSPEGKTVVSGNKERQGDFVFSAPTSGEFSFCFFNKVSTYAEKRIDFDITIENHALKSFDGQGHDELMTRMQEIGDHVGSIMRMQKFYRTRENRNFSTVHSTERRIRYFSVFESVAIMGMSLFQVVVVRRFFNAPKARSM